LVAAGAGAGALAEGVTGVSAGTADALVPTFEAALEAGLAEVVADTDDAVVLVAALEAGLAAVRVAVLAAAVFPAVVVDFVTGSSFPQCGIHGQGTCVC
jgi:uncharacterized protein (DUF1786 family)